MYDHSTDTTLWVPNSGVLIRARQSPAPPTGLMAEQDIILQAVAEQQAARRPRRRVRPLAWLRLRGRLTRLPT